MACYLLSRLPKTMEKKKIWQKTKRILRVWVQINSTVWLKLTPWEFRLRHHLKKRQLGVKITLLQRFNGHGGDDVNERPWVTLWHRALAVFLFCPFRLISTLLPTNHQQQGRGGWEGICFSPSHVYPRSLLLFALKGTNAICFYVKQEGGGEIKRCTEVDKSEN